MTQQEPGARAHTASLAGALRPVLADTLLALRGLELHIEVVSNPPDPTGWLDAGALTEPDSLPLSALLQRFKSAGFAFNKRAASASLMLRCGWASGFAIAAYLTRARVPFLRDFALHFSPSALLKGLWVRDAQFVGCPKDPLANGPEWLETVGEDVLRERLLASLIAFNEPLIAAHHAWSRFSRHALWAMATSSWAAQFASVGRQLGDESVACTRRELCWRWFRRSSARHRSSMRSAAATTRALARSFAPAASISRTPRGSSVRAVRSFPMSSGLSAIVHGLRRNGRKLGLERAQASNWSMGAHRNIESDGLRVQMFRLQIPFDEEDGRLR
jgi:hypothetical protein